MSAVAHNALPGAEWTRLAPALGIAVDGVDVRALDDAGFAALRALWLDADGLLVLRNQRLEPADQIDFSRRFGPLFGDVDQFQRTVHRYLLPGHPQIYRVSNKVKDGEPQGRARAGTYWHSDVSFRRQPAMASLLYALELPEVGGDTLFASMHAAYDALTPAMREMIAPLAAVHDFAVAAAAPRRYADGDVQEADLDDTNRASHPVVIRHPETGRSAVFVNPGFTSHIEGFTSAESRPLLDFLYAHCTRPEFVYRHSWSLHDLVIWDNRSLMHYAVADYTGDRYMHRTTVLAQAPQA